MKLKASIISILLCFVLLLSVGCFNNDNNNDIVAAGEEDFFKAGIYTAEATGNGGQVEVEVIFTENTIESIKIIYQSETPGIGDVALYKLTDDIVSRQSLKVDTVTGATITSNALLEAIANCVEQAGGDLETLRNGEIEIKQKDTMEKTAYVVIIGGWWCWTFICRFSNTKKC